LGIGKAGNENGNGNGNGNRNGNENGNGKSNHWTGLLKLPLSVGHKLNTLIQPITCSLGWSGIFP